LHPIIALTDRDFSAPRRLLDTSARDAAGGYCCHVVETLPAPDGFDIRRFLAPAA
jgi:hypothetical protein